MHHIRKSILISLANNAPLRFTQLRPPTVPNNAFSYHLKKLLETGYILPCAEGYKPTRKALKAVEYIGTQRKYLPPKLLTMLLILNEQGEVLLVRRRTSPFKGWYSIPSGMVHEGESLQEAASRELAEKTAIVAQDPLFLGMLDFRYFNRITEDTYVHAISFVYRYHLPVPKVSIVESPLYDEYRWSRLDHPDILPEVHEAFVMTKKEPGGVVSVKFDEPIMA